LSWNGFYYFSFMYLVKKFDILLGVGGCSVASLSSLWFVLWAKKSNGVGSTASENWGRGVVGLLGSVGAAVSMVCGGSVCSCSKSPQ
jgi:hypothetical protein